MSPEVRSHPVVARPHLLCVLLSFAVAGALTAPAAAQPRRDKGERGAPAKRGDGDNKPAGDAKGGDKKSDKPKVLDFTGLEFEGRLRTPQLLYFLDRASEELERASLERRSFLREVVRSVDEEEL